MSIRLLSSKETFENVEITAIFRYAPQKYLWSSYDAEADVLYINWEI